MNSNRLIALCHHRWNIPILALLAQHGGCKHITLLKKLGLSRDSLSHSLKSLIDLGLVSKNPGYGHPLRPEYILTPAGKPLARECEVLREHLQKKGPRELLLKKWVLPVLQVINQKALRFSEIKLRLPGITSRALTLTLKDLEQAEYVGRRIENAYPPRVVYQVKPKHQSILKPLLVLSGATQSDGGRSPSWERRFVSGPEFQ